MTAFTDGAGTGTVTSDIIGIDCGADCDETYDENTFVTLTAAPDSNSIFTGWSGGGCSSTDPCALTVDAGKAVTATFDLINSLPVAVTGGPYEAYEGTGVTLDATGSYDTDGAIVSYAWDLDNNGTYETLGSFANYDMSSLDGPGGPFTIGLRVTDDDGATGTATTTVTVLNSPPIADANGPYICVAGGALSLSGSATDPSASDTLVYAWDLDGDGAFETPGRDIEHIFQTAEVYLVTLKVTDDDGGEGTGQTTVTVQAKVVLSLPMGWNFFGWRTANGFYKGDSLPAQSDYATGVSLPEVPSLSTILSSLSLPESSYAVVIGPDGTVYVPDSPFNTLTSLLPGRSYWVYLTAPVLLEIPGLKLSDVTSTLQLEAGWVSVAYWGTDGAEPATAFACIAGLYDVVLDGMGRVYIPGSPFNTLLTARQSDGYYLHITGPGVLTYSCSP